MHQINTPQVSVVMITYNHEKFIEEAITGVLKQDCDFSIELIVADDCSNDQTQRIVTEIINNHPNKDIIRYTRHDINKGMNPNFIWATKQARGKYIALCEGDDYWTDSHKLQKQFNYMESSPNCSFCFHKVNELDGDRLYEDSLNEKNIEKFHLKEILNKNYAHTPSIMFRADQLTIPCFFYNAMPGDHALQCILLRNGGYAFYMNEAMAVYRKHDGGVWSSDDGSKFYFERSKSRLELYKFLNVKNKSLIEHYLYQLADSVSSEGYKKISRLQYLQILSLHFNLFDFFRLKYVYIVFPVFVNKHK